MRILVWTVGQYWRLVVLSHLWCLIQSTACIPQYHTPHYTTPHHSGLGANIFTNNIIINLPSPSTFREMLFCVVVAAGRNVKWIIYRKSNGLITVRAGRRLKDVERCQKMDTNYNSAG